MFIKFCENAFNIAEGCNTIALGTLGSYANDDPNFLRHDYSEGNFTIKNFGNKVDLNSNESQRITGGGLVGGGMSLAQGSNFTRSYSFPNCYIFCFSQFVTPNIENARKIDPAYDSWYRIADLNKFISCVVNLLSNNLLISDLNLPPEVKINDLNNLSIQVVHRPIEIRNKTGVLSDDSKESVISIGDNPIDWLFFKEEKYRELNEYRIAFIVLDSYGQPISVKPKSKIINIKPDLGISKITPSTSG